jgi:hypothetical protein
MGEKMKHLIALLRDIVFDLRANFSFIRAVLIGAIMVYLYYEKVDYNMVLVAVELALINSLFLERWGVSSIKYGSLSIIQIITYWFLSISIFSKGGSMSLGYVLYMMLSLAMSVPAILMATILAVFLQYVKMPVRK